VRDCSFSQKIPIRVITEGHEGRPNYDGPHPDQLAAEEADEIEDPSA